MLERRRLEEETAQLEAIQGSVRRRVPIARTLDVPHRWICLLQTSKVDPSDRALGLGTGVLVGPRHVLTAAHVLVSEADPGRTVGDRLRVQPARNGHDRPFDPVKVRAWQVDARWIERRRGVWRAVPRFDYGLVVLDRDVSAWTHRRLGGGALGYWGAPGRPGHGSEVGATPALASGREAQVAGYPGEKPQGTLWTATGRLRHDPRLGVLAHTASTSGGQSGSPVWFVRGSRACLAGIHSRAGTLSIGPPERYLDNFAVPVTPELVREVESWMQTLGR